jgi:hypothetical protein
MKGHRVGGDEKGAAAAAGVVAVGVKRPPKNKGNTTRFLCLSSAKNLRVRHKM